MSNKNILQALQSAGGAGGAGLDVDEVFSTYLYTGTGSTLNIVNGIDLAGEGGLVWHKYRGGTSDHGLFDTERGVSRKLGSNNTGAQTAAFSGYGITAFNSNGYTLGTQYSGENGNGNEVVSWTFRKAPQFFDVVTFTLSNASKDVPHSLNGTVGSIFMKRTDSSQNWYVWHRGAASGNYLSLNNSNAQSSSDNMFGTHTDTTINVGAGWMSGTFVAYIFAHNDGDGEFGPDGDQDIIKCGSYTGTGHPSNPSTQQTIELGFEPQWFLTKRTNSGASWQLVDNMRGMADEYERLYPDQSASEDFEGDGMIPTPTGIRFTGGQAQHNASGGNYIYMAIRRGSLFTPEDADDVFAIATQNEVASAKYGYYSGFPVDMAWRALTTGEQGYLATRITGARERRTDQTTTDNTQSYVLFDDMESWWNLTSTATNRYSWMFKRAPGFFDVVAWNGSSASTRVLNHNLGVAPQMIWAKNRNDTDSWVCYHEATGNTGYIPLNLTSGFLPSSGAWSNTTPSATTFKVGNNLNWSSSFNYIAMLFATVSGVSKVGSYTGNGTSQTIDCGFTAGASFVLVKRTSPSGDWRYFDTKRGIVAGTDTSSKFNATAGGMRTGYDDIDPDNSGFIINETSVSNLNVSGAPYIFYAIA